MPLTIEELRNIERKVNHYKYLDKYFPDFFFAVTGRTLEQEGMTGIVTADGDKGRGAAMKTRKAGIPYPHMMMLYLLSYSDYCKADFGQHRIEEWIIEEYQSLGKLMPEVDLNDKEILSDFL